MHSSPHPHPTHPQQVTFKHSADPSARHTIEDLFVGKRRHVTCCMSCGRESERSKQREDYYELDLQVQRMRNLETALATYLSTVSCARCVCVGGTEKVGER